MKAMRSPVPRPGVAPDPSRVEPMPEDLSSVEGLARNAGNAAAVQAIGRVAATPETGGLDVMDAVGGALEQGGSGVAGAADPGAGAPGAPAAPPPPDAPPDPVRALQLARTGRASPLPYRSEMESVFGRDFSEVECYLGLRATMACAMVGARAFTVGNVVVFGSPQPDRDMVRHELTHVVQQSGSTGAPAGISSPSDAHEHAAEHADPAEVTPDGGGPRLDRMVDVGGTNSEVLGALLADVAPAGISGRAMDLWQQGEGILGDVDGVKGAINGVLAFPLDDVGALFSSDTYSFLDPSGFFEGLKPTGDDLVENTVSVTLGICTGALGFLDGLLGSVDRIVGTLKKLVDLMKNVSRALGVVSKILKGIAAALAATLFGAGAAGVLFSIARTLDTIKTTVDTIAEFVQNAVIDPIQPWIEKLRGVRDTIQHVAEVCRIVQAACDVYDWLTADTAEERAAAAADILGNIDAVGSLLGDFEGNRYAAFGDLLWDKAGPVLETGLHNVVETVPGGGGEGGGAGAPGAAQAGAAGGDAKVDDPDGKEAPPLPPPDISPEDDASQAYKGTGDEAKADAEKSGDDDTREKINSPAELARYLRGEAMARAEAAKARSEEEAAGAGGKGAGPPGGEKEGGELADAVGEQVSAVEGATGATFTPTSLPLATQTAATTPLPALPAPGDGQGYPGGVHEVLDFMNGLALEHDHADTVRVAAEDRRTEAVALQENAQNAITFARQQQELSTAHAEAATRDQASNLDGVDFLGQLQAQADELVAALQQKIDEAFGGSDAAAVAGDGAFSLTEKGEGKAAEAYDAGDGGIDIIKRVSKALLKKALTALLDKIDITKTIKNLLPDGVSKVVDQIGQFIDLVEQVQGLAGEKKAEHAEAQQQHATNAETDQVAIDTATANLEQATAIEAQAQENLAIGRELEARAVSDGEAAVDLGAQADADLAASEAGVEAALAPARALRPRTATPPSLDDPTGRLGPPDALPGSDAGPVVGGQEGLPEGATGAPDAVGRSTAPEPPATVPAIGTDDVAAPDALEAADGPSPEREDWSAPVTDRGPEPEPPGGSPSELPAWALDEGGAGDVVVFAPVASIVQPLRDAATRRRLPPRDRAPLPDPTPVIAERSDAHARRGGAVSDPLGALPAVAPPDVASELPEVTPIDPPETAPVLVDVDVDAVAGWAGAQDLAVDLAGDAPEVELPPALVAPEAGAVAPLVAEPLGAAPTGTPAEAGSVDLVTEVDAARPDALTAAAPYDGVETVRWEFDDITLLVAQIAARIDSLAGDVLASHLPGLAAVDAAQVAAVDAAGAREVEARTELRATLAAEQTAGLQSWDDATAARQDALAAELSTTRDAGIASAVQLRDDAVARADVTQAETDAATAALTAQAEERAAALWGWDPDYAVAYAEQLGQLALRVLDDGRQRVADTLAEATDASTAALAGLDVTLQALVTAAVGDTDALLADAREQADAATADAEAADAALVAESAAAVQTAAETADADLHAEADALVADRDAAVAPEAAEVDGLWDEFERFHLEFAQLVDATAAAHEALLAHPDPVLDTARPAQDDPAHPIDEAFVREHVYPAIVAAGEAATGLTAEGILVHCPPPEVVRRDLAELAAPLQHTLTRWMDSTGGGTVSGGEAVIGFSGEDSFASRDAAIAWAALEMDRGRKGPLCVARVDADGQPVFLVLTLDIDPATYGTLDEHTAGRVHVDDPNVVAFVYPGMRAVMVDATGATRGAASASEAAEQGSDRRFTGYVDVAVLHAGGQLDLDETSAGTLADLNDAALVTRAREMIRDDALRTLEKNRAYVKDVVRERYRGAERSNNAEKLRKLTDELIGLRTAAHLTLNEYQKWAWRETDANRKAMQEDRFVHLNTARTAQGNALSYNQRYQTLVQAATLLMQQYPELALTFQDNSASAGYAPDADTYQNRIAGDGTIDICNMLSGNIEDVLAAMDLAHERIASGEIDPFALDGPLARVKGQLEGADPKMGAALDGAVRAHNRGELIQGLLIGALDVGLAVAGAWGSGGVSLVASAAGAISSGVQAAATWKSVSDQLLLADTHLDPNQALVTDSKEWLVFWASVETALALVDVGDAVASVQAARKAAKAAAETPIRTALDEVGESLSPQHAAALASLPPEAVEQLVAAVGPARLTALRGVPADTLARWAVACGPDGLTKLAALDVQVLERLAGLPADLLPRLLQGSPDDLAQVLAAFPGGALAHLAPTRSVAELRQLADLVYAHIGSELSAEQCEDLLQAFGGNWFALRDTMLKLPDTHELQAQLIRWRKRLVDQHVDRLCKELGVTSEGFGSSNLASDYDISFRGERAAEAVSRFNAEFAEKWGVQSGSALDTNVYTTGAYLSEALPTAAAQQELAALTAAGQDALSLVKVRKYKSADEWRALRQRVLDGLPVSERLKTAERFDLADHLYKSSEAELKARCVQLDAEYAAKTQKIGLKTDQVPVRPPDVELAANNQLYAQKLEKLQGQLTERKRVFESIKSWEKPTEEEQELIKRVIQMDAEIKQLQGEALLHANEPYFSDGAVLHAVGDQMKKQGLEVPRVISAPELLHSFDEQFGFIGHEMHHYDSFGKTAYRASKYLDRFTGSASQLLSKVGRPPSIRLGRLQTLADAWAPLRAGRIAADEAEAIRFAERIARDNGFTGARDLESYITDVWVDINTQVRPLLSD